MASVWNGRTVKQTLVLPNYDRMPSLFENLRNSKGQTIELLDPISYNPGGKMRLITNGNLPDKWECISAKPSLGNYWLRIDKNSEHPGCYLFPIDGTVGQRRWNQPIHTVLPSGEHVFSGGNWPEGICLRRFYWHKGPNQGSTIDPTTVKHPRSIMQGYNFETFEFRFFKKNYLFQDSVPDDGIEIVRCLTALLIEKFHKKDEVQTVVRDVFKKWNELMKNDEEMGMKTPTRPRSSGQGSNNRKRRKNEENEVEENKVTKKDVVTTVDSSGEEEEELLPTLEELQPAAIRLNNRPIPNILKKKTKPPILKPSATNIFSDLSSDEEKEDSDTTRQVTQVGHKQKLKKKDKISRNGENFVGKENLDLDSDGF